MLKQLFLIFTFIEQKIKLTHFSFYCEKYFLTTENAYCVIELRIVTIIAETVSYNYFKK